MAGSTIAPWAAHLACVLANEERGTPGFWNIHEAVGSTPLAAFARYIEKHSVDPDLIEARRIVSCAKSGRYGPAAERAIEEGKQDDSEPVQAALAGIKWGRKMAEESK